MEDRKIADILASSFNSLAVQEEANREDEEVLEQLRDRKRQLCYLMDKLNVTRMIEFEHSVRACVKEDTCAQESVAEQLRVEKIAIYLVDYYNENRNVLKRGVFTGDERRKLQVICSVTEKYLSALGLGEITEDGEAVVCVTKPTDDYR